MMNYSVSGFIPLCKSSGDISLNYFCSDRFSFVLSSPEEALHVRISRKSILIYSPLNTILVGSTDVSQCGNNLKNIKDDIIEIDGSTVSLSFGKKNNCEEFYWKIFKVKNPNAQVKRIIQTLDDYFLLSTDHGLFELSDEIPSYKCISDFPIMDACKCKDIYYAINSSNEVISFSQSGEIEKLHDYQGKVIKAKKIQSGFEHVIILNENGNVYTLGNGTKGQLGLGNVVSREEHPQLIECFTITKIVDIAAGGWHTLALSELGEVFGWGWNNNSQLGKEQPTVVASPISITSQNNTGLEEIDVTLISAGSKHSVMVDTYGKIWGLGNNTYGQLGTSKEYSECSKLTQAFPINPSKKISSIQCGAWSTLISYDK